MVAIKDRKMPKGCQHCRFFRKHLFGNGLDYSYSCELGATEFPMPWIRQMEERPSDCPLVEIGTCKDCKYVSQNDDNDRYCGLSGGYYDPNYYCVDFEKRGNENGSN